MTFHITSKREIQSGKVTDVYFKRALDALRLSGKDRDVVVEVSAGELPDGFAWGVLAGVDEVIELLRGRNLDMSALPEGSLFSAKEPVVTIKARYSDIAVLETALLGFLCQASGVATKAAHFRICSRGKSLLSFGARRMHPAVAPMIDRAAYIGGFDGVAVVASAERLGIEPSGTMPHSLILLVGDTVEAFGFFHKAVEKGVPRIALVDTFGDEKVETLRLAKAYANVLNGVRIDTPASRRGSLKDIVEEIRWELDMIGCGHVNIFVSGGLALEDVEALAPHVDGFGIGTSLSNAKVINFGLDIVQIRDEPVTKKGKMSGEKEVACCDSCKRRIVLPKRIHDTQCECGGKIKSLYKRFLRQGKDTMKTYPPAKRIRSHLLESLKSFSGG